METHEIEDLEGGTLLKTLLISCKMQPFVLGSSSAPLGKFKIQLRKPVTVLDF